MSLSSPKRIRQSEKYPEWGNLPIELSAAVAKRLTLIGDYISFRGVCSSWRSAATFGNFGRDLPRVPFLMYSAEKREEKTNLGDDVAEKREGKTNLGDDVAETSEEKTILDYDVRKFTGFVSSLFDPQENDVGKVTNWVEVNKNIVKIVVKKVSNLFDLQSKTHKTTNFPPATGVPYLSSSGWILYLLNGSVDVALTHFIWRVKIRLPSLSTFPGENRGTVIRKMVLSASPTIKTDFVVMVIWGDKNQLGFCRPGDDSWTVMSSWEGSFSDIIYHNRKLYAVDCRLRIVECDVHGRNPTEIRQVSVWPETDYDLSFGGARDDLFNHNLWAVRVMHYLVVESSGRFLIVSRHFIKNKTLGFRVFDIDLMDGSHRKIDHLGDRALFLGCNSSICVEVSASSKVKPNRIYFTDNVGRFEVSDTGVYNLSTGRIKGFFDGSGIVSPPPTWVVPSF